MLTVRMFVTLALGSAELLFGQAAGEEFRANHATGESYLRQGKLREAIPYLERAALADPDHYANSWDLAVAYLETGNLAAARGQIQKLLARKDAGELHNLLADVEERAGNYLEASRQYQLAAEMDPTEKHLQDWGNQLLRHRANEAALKVYLHAVERHPKSAPLRVGLAVAYHSRGRYDDAARTLCEAIDLDPADLRALSFLGELHEISSDWESEVSKRLGNFVRLYPENPLAHHYYALSLWKLPDADLAKVETHLKTAARLNTRFPDTRFQLGKIYDQQGRDADAVREYEAAIGLQPDLDTAHYRLAGIYRRMGQKDRARKEFETYERLHQAKRTEMERKETSLPALIVR